MPRGDGLKRKCKAHSQVTGAPCQKWALEGLEVCRTHGGATERSKAKSQHAKAARVLGNFVKPIPADNPLSHPIAAFEWEFRRTVGRIIWYDEQLAEMESEDLEWGVTKHETATGTIGIPNTTYEARANTLHELQYRERQHMTEMTKVWIGAHLDERKLNIQAQHVRALDNAIVGILTRLGLDVGDPLVRQTVREELLVLEPRRA